MKPVWLLRKSAVPSNLDHCSAYVFPATIFYSVLWPFRFQQVLANPLTENFISNVYVDTLHGLNFIDVLDTEIRESVATLVYIYERITRVIVPRFEIFLAPLRNTNIMLALLMFARDLKAYVETIKDI